MSVSLVTFSTREFYYASYTLLRSARKYGVDRSYAYTMSDFSKTEFFLKYKNIASQKRGAGYWIWKPYYILHHLEKLNEDEVLIYCDAGLDVIDNLGPLIELVKQEESGILLFENYQGVSYYNRAEGIEISEVNIYNEMNKCKYWTKRDAFILMDADSSEYWEAPQVDASFQIYRKTNISIQFLNKWIAYCCNEQILTDLPNKMGKENFPSYIGHIHDQAIISILAKKYQLNLYRCATQFGNHLKLPEYRVINEFKLLPYSKSPKFNSRYAQILNHHRTKYSSIYFRWRLFLGQEKNVLIGWLFSLFYKLEK